MATKPGRNDHEFLVFVVQSTFGEGWTEVQLRLPDERRHVVSRWCLAWADHMRERQCMLEANPNATRIGATGPTWALLQLGYDLFVLQARNRLPDFLVERLRHPRQFQGARYEVAVAAIANLPPDAGETTPFEERPMRKDVMRMDDQIAGCAPERPDPHAALFITSFAPHYGWADGKCYKCDWVMSVPKNTQHPMPRVMLERIYETVGRYEQIPDEI